MRWLVAISLRNRIVVIALGVLLVVAAVRTLPNTALDVFPEFAPPLVEVQTEAPGLSTNEVESLVTVPLESALNGIPGLRTIRSKSVLGLSQVVLILDPAEQRDGRAPDGAGTVVAHCCAASGCRPLTCDALAVVVAQSCHEGGHHLGHAVAGRADDAGEVDDAGRG